VYQQVVALGELPVTEPAYELFFGSRCPADATRGRSHSRGTRSRGHRAKRARAGTRGWPTEQRRMRLATVLATRVEQERVTIAPLVHDRL